MPTIRSIAGVMPSAPFKHSWMKSRARPFAREHQTGQRCGVADALLAKKADCFVMNSLDPVITQKALNPLTDDKAMFFSNALVALLSEKQASSALSTALDKVNNTLTTARLNQMLNEIVANHTDPVVVANAFLDTL